MAASGPRVMESHEPCQVREEAAVSGPFHVPRCILETVINEDCKAFLLRFNYTDAAISIAAYFFGIILLDYVQKLNSYYWYGDCNGLSSTL